eukprot:UN31611
MFGIVPTDYDGYYEFIEIKEGAVLLYVRDGIRNVVYKNPDCKIKPYGNLSVKNGDKLGILIDFSKGSVKFLINGKD